MQRDHGKPDTLWNSDVVNAHLRAVSLGPPCSFAHALTDRSLDAGSVRGILQIITDELLGDPVWPGSWGNLSSKVSPLNQSQLSL